MGLQTTAATKRKHDITFDSKDMNAYTNCPTPIKTGRWSTELENSSSTNKHAPNSISMDTEDSIAKLEVVAAVPCEPWTSHTEPVDCISKLQAVAVPSDPWGSISTRSTLATTLLSADELEDDDDDFEDDYEEEESIIPTYCPIRYHPCGPPSAANQRNYSPSAANGYNNRPNYYSEPLTQQNCARTGNQHLRNSNGGNFNHWSSNSSTNNTNNSFYVPPEAAYPPQQTIRCAENGKSYLELGCSNSFNTSASTNRINSNGFSNSMDARHSLKRCCDGRGGTWCNTSNNCYKDTRLKIRNLSMFKLSRFRQVSEQSLYRSVLICNTLKYIDREIESEAKELHQQQQQQHQLMLSHHHLHSHHQHNHHNHHQNHLHHQQHLQQQQQQQQHQQANTDYSPVMGCARISNGDYHQQSNQFQGHVDSRDCSQNSYSPMNSLISKPAAVTPVFSNNSQQQQQCATESLHPYDHYPFREGNSGRATPFPPSHFNDTDSGYGGDDDTNRSINWSSVLSLSSQSALDPLNNNELFSILPASTTNSATTSVASTNTVVSISGTFTASIASNATATAPTSAPVTAAGPTATVPATQTTQAPTSPQTSTTITQLASSTVSKQPTTSAVISGTVTTTAASSSSSSSHSNSSSNSSSSTSASATSAWEYGFLDMDFGLGSEFTELVPSCKLSSDDLFKNVVSPVSALNSSRYSPVHDNELEHPAHIMVGS